MIVSKAKHFETDTGWVIIVKIGKRINTSYFSNPAKSVDHAHLEYFQERFPLITTEKRMIKFKELYKTLGF